MTRKYHRHQHQHQMCNEISQWMRWGGRKHISIHGRMQTLRFLHYYHFHCNIIIASVRLHAVVSDLSPIIFITNIKFFLFIGLNILSENSECTFRRDIYTGCCSISKMDGRWKEKEMHSILSFCCLFLIIYDYHVFSFHCIIWSNFVAAL